MRIKLFKIICTIIILFFEIQTTYASSTSVINITGNQSSFILNNSNASGNAISFASNNNVSLSTTSFASVSIPSFPSLPTPNILAININGHTPQTIAITGNTNNAVTIGPIVDTAGSNKVKISVTNGQTVQLIGTAFNGGSLTNGFTASQDDYSALQEIDFGGGAGTLSWRINGLPTGNSNDRSVAETLNTTFSNASTARLQLISVPTTTITNPSIGTFGTIEFDGYINLQTLNGETTFFTNQWSIGQVDAFTALTPVVFTSPTIGSGFLNVGHLHIGSVAVSNLITIKPISNVDSNGSSIYEAYRGNTKYYGFAGQFAGQPDPSNLGYSSGIFISRIYWDNVNSELKLDSGNSNSDLTFDTPGSDLVNGVVGNPGTWGILTLNAQNHSLTLTTTSTAVSGPNPVARPRLISNATLKTLNINGNSNLTLDLEGNVSIINLHNSAPQILFTQLANPLNGSAASTINLSSDAHIKHSINAHGITINLSTFELDLTPNVAGDTIRLGSNLPIILNTTFDHTSVANGKGGHLLLSGISTLDLSNTSTIQVNLTTDGTLPSARREFAYKIIDPSLSSIINYGVIPNFTVSGTQNAYSTWNFDFATYTLYTITDFSYLPANIASNGASPNAVAITAALVNAYNSGNDNATAALQQITTNDPLQAAAALVASDIGDIVTGEAGDIATLAATTRIISDENLLAQSEISGVAAGNKPGRSYGTWISPFYQKAIQKPHGIETGYKLANHGGTIGADTKISDDTTLGIALTYLKAIINCSQAKIDSKAHSNTGVLSFYGKTFATRGIYLSAIGSFGISKIKSKEKRSANPAVIDYANTRYKSYFHTISVIGSKDYDFDKFKNILFTPIIGIRYAHFKDDSYKETDSLILNTSVDAKSNYGIDGIIGGKIQGLYELANGYTLLPETSSFAYLNLKHKQAAMRISSNAFNDPVTLTGAKPSRAWYALGAGLTAQKDSIEYGLQYEAGFDKKYISHQFAFKIRIDF